MITVNWIETFSSLIPILFLTLIPLRSRVSKLQEQYKLEDMAAQGKIDEIIKKSKKSLGEEEVDLDKDNEP